MYFRNIFLALILSNLVQISYSQTTSDEKAIQDLIQNSFDELFSEFNTEKVSDFYTEDFILLEQGEVWDLEMINSYFVNAKNDPDRATRLNQFEFIKTTIKGNQAWIAYHNYATFKKDGAVVMEIHWLESATATKTNDGWRLDMLHSTRVNE
jgi:ketosteroid isomerase-like protein